MLRQPATTHKTAHRWLLDRGYRVGMTAVRNHRKDFNEQLVGVRQAAEMSYVCGELARQTGAPVMADGAVARFETLLSQALFGLQEGKALDKTQWEMLGKALTNAVDTRTKVEALYRVFDRAKRDAAARGEAPGAAAPESDGKTVTYTDQPNNIEHHQARVRAAREHPKGV